MFKVIKIISASAVIIYLAGVLLYSVFNTLEISTHFYSSYTELTDANLSWIGLKKEDLEGASNIKFLTEIDLNTSVWTWTFNNESDIKRFKDLIKSEYSESNYKCLKSFSLCEAIDANDSIVNYYTEKVGDDCYIINEYSKKVIYSSTACSPLTTTGENYYLNYLTHSNFNFVTSLGRNFIQNLGFGYYILKMIFTV
jgi:hypothetical protein